METKSVFFSSAFQCDLYRLGHQFLASRQVAHERRAPACFGHVAPKRLEERTAQHGSRRLNVLLKSDRFSTE